MAILKTYPCDGTAGSAVTTGNSGFAAISGTIVYDSTGKAIEVGPSVTAYGEDQTAGDYCAIWFSVAAIPTGTDEAIAAAMNGATTLAAVRVRSTGAISIYSGLGTLVGTTTAVITAGTQYRIEWNTRTDGQELRLYAARGATAIETLTGAVASALATNKRRVGHPQSAQSAGTVDIFQATINDAWPNAANVAPVVNAGPDQTNVAAGATVTLDGTGSSDADGDPLTYAWTQTAGGTVTLSSTSVAQPTFTAPSTPSAQTLTFSLVVTDNQGASSSADTVNIGVLAAVTPGAGTILKSYPCDGTAGAAVTTGNSGFISVSGTMVFNLTGGAIEVADGVTAYGEDQTAGDYCAIWVSVPALPTGTDECIAFAMNGSTTLAAIRVRTTGAISIYSGTSTLVGTTAALISTATQYRLEWNTRTDGQELRLYSARGTTPIETVAGAVTSALSTTKRRFGHPQTAQSAGVVDIFEATINSGWPNASNIAPVANAGPDQLNVAAGATITLDGTGSSDPDGDPISYSWSQTAGEVVTLSSVTAARPSFVAPSNGSPETLTFSLVVTDNQGAASAPDTVTVSVLAVAQSNLKIRISGTFVTAVEKVRIGGSWVAVTGSLLSGGSQDDSLYSDSYADTY